MTKLSDDFMILEHALNPDLSNLLPAPQPGTIDAHLAHVLTYLRILTRHVEILTRTQAALAFDAQQNLAAIADTPASATPPVDVVPEKQPLEPLTHETMDIPPLSTIRDPEELIL